MAVGQRTLALTILEAEIEATPVDTARARSNWQMFLDTPVFEDIDPYVPYPEYSQANGAAADEQANVEPTLQAARAVLTAHQPGQTIYIVNAVQSKRGYHYLSALNYGHSRQAPSFFIQLALATAVATYLLTPTSLLED